MKGRNMDNRTSIGPGAIHEDFAAVSDVFGAEIEDPHSLYREYRKSQPVMEGDILARFNVGSEEHTSELQSLMRISYAVFCLKKQTHNTENNEEYNQAAARYTSCICEQTTKHNYKY